MPLRTWKCPSCGVEFRTKAKEPAHCEDIKAEPVLTAPTTKFMEKTDPEKGTSAVIGQTAILKARARSHSRDIDMEDLIQNNDRESAFKNGWLTKDGIKRKKIDDK